MSRYYWNGGDGSTDDEKGSFNRAGNWKTATGGAGAVPTPSDSYVFDERAAIVPVGYSGTKHEIGKHYNCFADMASCPIDCQGVEINNFTGLIGKDTAGNETWLKVSLVAGKVLRFKSNCTALIQAIGHASLSKYIPLLQHDSETGVLRIKCGAEAVKGQFTLIETYNKGSLTIEDSTKLVDLYAYPNPNLVANVITISIGESVPTHNLYAGQGNIYTDSPLSTIQNYGANLYLGSEQSPMLKTDLTFVSFLSLGGTTQIRANCTIQTFEQRAGAITLVGDGDKTIGNNNVVKLMGGTFNAGSLRGELKRGGTSTIRIENCDVTLPRGLSIDSWST